MREPKRIGIDLLDANLRGLIEVSTKIFPVNITYVQAGTNPGGYPYVRITEGDERNNIYIWREESSTWELIGADDTEIHWVDIQSKPVSFPPSAHGHTKADITDFAHQHTVTDITDFPAEMPPAAHEHDDRYYTETEVDNSLLLKVDKVTGKELSTNDFTNEHKTKLEQLTENASFDFEQMQQALEDHTSDTAVHVTQLDKDSWNTVPNKADKTYVDTQLASKVGVTTFNGHADNTVIHVTSTDKTNWNAAYTDMHVHANKPVLDKITASGAEPSFDLSNFVTQEELGNAGLGDMVKSVYDFNNDGKVNSADAADSVPWAGVTGKPSTFPPDVHTHSLDEITETTTKKIMTDAERTKLAGVAANANNYVHPATHPPSIIAQDASNRFMTDAERTKLSGIQAGAEVNTVDTVAGRTGAVVLASSDVGLGSVQNFGLATQAEAEAGASSVKYMTPQQTAQAIAALAPPEIVVSATQPTSAMWYKVI